MTNWTFRILMTLMAFNLVLAVYAMVTYKPPAEMCLNGIVMVPDSKGDMWVQKGWWPTHCILVDKD